MSTLTANDALPVAARSPTGGAGSAESLAARRRLLGFVVMCFGMFMAILDIQIVSASLSEIQAGLSASADEIPWVQTSYLIAEVIAIPLSGYLSRALGTRVLFTVAAAGFTLASVMCGLSSSINSMILWRALQGFIGGGMIPTVFAAAYIIFPGPRQKMVAPVVGLIATLAPTIGPTVGGYVTEAMSWHWLFFINIVPGIAVSLLAWMLIDIDKPDYSLLNRFDWWGLLSMAGFLGAAEYVLEEGPRKGWFDEDAILMLAVLSVGCAIAFFARSLMAKNPIVDLRAFTNRNFAVGSLFSFVLGIGLYGLTYLYPVYLAQVRGYNALMIGETMFVSGVAMFMTAPVVGQLTQRVDPRYILITGFLLFAIGTWQMTGLTKDWDFYELLWPQIFRGVGLMAAMVPVTNTALGTLDPARLKNASGLFNLTRNLGGAIGLAVINTLLNDRMDLHLVRLHEAVNGASVAATETLDQLTQKFGGSDGALQALKQVSMMVRQQALVMSFADVFWMLTVMFVMLAAMGIFMRKPQAAGGGGGGH
ncbi:MFS transporter [Pseudolabrys sp. Root1462]|jgi:MFS transporter, DHA2 family, multidrug resistance protein|uniref:DHA2 family efflux MFS transporter permease subunit n=1 Tax=Pseudolabrys sp. Root1462 TaxID=1736466 RepID=UPI000702A39D|nr:DHA2 family efflux MFS transporter permease subunit [Pseudolabrys sp. Root1462]KQY99950.1 MFS transporter [Pseudolabrys sp. Root1462]